jgi:hypothetical protein
MAVYAWQNAIAIRSLDGRPVFGIDSVETFATNFETAMGG